MSTDVQVPTLGESITEGTLAQWLKKPGEAVKADEPIATLETDKVSVDVPSPVAGVLTEQMVEEGDNVAVGAVIARVDQSATPSAASVASSGKTNPAGAGENPQLRGTPHAPEPSNIGEGEPVSDEQITTLSPAVRRAVLEHHVDPTKIRGSGKDGRLTKDDVLAAAQAQKEPHSPAEAPKSSTGSSETIVEISSSAERASRHEERIKISRLRQTIAKRLKDAQNTAAMLTTFNDVDMTAVMDARSRYKDLFEKKHGIRLGFMGFFVKACALAARDVPSVNASIEGDEIVYHEYLDVSVAVSAPKGLVVPVVRDADRMSFAEIEKRIADYGKRAKDGTLGVDDMQGGTFTISNGGVFGSLLSTPIINPPQAAVLGMHRIEERPVVRNKEIVARPMMYLALTYDHRLIDGREAVTFLVRVKEAIEDPTRLLIDL